MPTNQSALDVVKMGQGPDLVLLHSLLSDRTAFDRIAPRLAAERRVWLVNLPGFGASAPSGPGLEQFADRIAEELPTLGLSGKADLLGNGFGGFVSVALAVRHGAMFDRLMFVDTGAAIPPEGKGAFAMMAQRVERSPCSTIAPRSRRFAIRAWSSSACAIPRRLPHSPMRWPKALPARSS